jgi:hypothetical protein
VLGTAARWNRSGIAGPYAVFAPDGAVIAIVVRAGDGAGVLAPA